MRPMIPRLHSVRLKSGGAKLRIMHSPRGAMSDNLRCTLQKNAEEIWSEFDGTVAGFSLVAWSSDGATASYVYNTKFSPVPNALIPRMIEECARRSMTNVQIHSALGHDDHDDGAA